MSLRDETLEMHKRDQDKLEAKPNVKVTSKEELSLAYSPGVAEPHKDIYENKGKVYDYTVRGNTVAVITDGAAALGLGNTEPGASIPVMEGKAVLSKNFASIDGMPIVLNTTDAEEIIKIIKLLEPNYGGINLEDVSAPRCLEIEERLKKEANIPISHDDQHGITTITMAGLADTLGVISKGIAKVKAVLNGAGAAGIAIVKLPYTYGVRNMVMYDSRGAIFEERSYGMSPTKGVIARRTNRNKIEGSLEEVVRNADIFTGVPVANALSQDMVRSMADDPIIFAMASPSPEIIPDDAKVAGVRVTGTGRSSYPNQINNVLTSPDIFRGVLKVETTHINEKTKKTAVEAIADLIDSSELNEDYCTSGPSDKRIMLSVVRNVAKAAMESGVARTEVDPQDAYDRTVKLTDSQ